MTTKNIQDVVAERVEELWQQASAPKSEDDMISKEHIRTTLTQLVREERERIGEELMRRAEGEAVAHKDGGLVMIPAHKVFEHITSLTGVE